jgi:ankyrin repeat protein
VPKFRENVDGATVLAHAIMNEHSCEVVSALIAAGCRVTPVYPCSDHLTLAAALNPSKDPLGLSWYNSPF